MEKGFWKDLKKLCKIVIFIPSLLSQHRYVQIWNIQTWNLAEICLWVLDAVLHSLIILIICLHLAELQSFKQYPVHLCEDLYKTLKWMILKHSLGTVCVCVISAQWKFPVKDILTVTGHIYVHLKKKKKMSLNMHRGHGGYHTVLSCG